MRRRGSDREALPRGRSLVCSWQNSSHCYQNLELEPSGCCSYSTSVEECTWSRFWRSSWDRWHQQALGAPEQLTKLPLYWYGAATLLVPRTIRSRWRPRVPLSVRSSRADERLRHAWLKRSPHVPYRGIFLQRSGDLPLCALNCWMEVS